MILDRFENKECYIDIHPYFKQAFAYIEEYLKCPKEPGVYEINGRELFAKVQEYQTREDGFFEVHDKYIDVQYMVEGEEKVYYAAREGMKPAMEYDEQEDALILQDTQDMMEFTFRAGEFAVFFPQDAHKPAMKMEKIASAKKVVIKVKLL